MGAVLATSSSNQHWRNSEGFSKPAKKTLDVGGGIGGVVELDINSGKLSSVCDGFEPSGVRGVVSYLVDSPDSASVVGVGLEIRDKDALTICRRDADDSGSENFTRCICVIPSSWRGSYNRSDKSDVSIDVKGGKRAGPEKGHTGNDSG